MARSIIENTCMQFRKYVEFHRAMLSGDAWSRADDKLGANVWDGALSSKGTLSFVVQWYRELLLSFAYSFGTVR